MFSILIELRSAEIWLSTVLKQEGSSNWQNTVCCFHKNSKSIWYLLVLWVLKLFSLPLHLFAHAASYLYPSFQGLMSDNDTVRLGLDFQRMLRINHMLYIAARSVVTITHLLVLNWLFVNLLNKGTNDNLVLLLIDLQLPIFCCLIH